MTPVWGMIGGAIIVMGVVWIITEIQLRRLQKEIDKEKR